MNVEQVKDFIRAANAFLELYYGAFADDELIFDPIMKSIMKLATKLRLPHLSEHGAVTEWLMPTTDQMNIIVERSKRIFGDAG